MEPSVTVALTVVLLAGLGFGLNEATHGGMAEAMGLGHHHLFGDAGWHCERGELGAHGHRGPNATACAGHAHSHAVFSP